MSILPALALASSVLAAAGFYVASPNCLWRSMQQWRRRSMATALLLCLLSMAAWIDASGFGVGLCAMLGTAMLTMALLPWIALRTFSSMSAITTEND